MRKRYLPHFLLHLLLLAASTLAPIYAQNSNIIWQRTIENFADDIHVATTSDGSVGVARSIRFNGTVADLTKLNPDGSVAWMRSSDQLGLQPGNPTGRRLLQLESTNDGGFVLIGRYQYFVRGAILDQNVFVKVNSAGDLVWVRNLPVFDLNFSNIVSTTDGGYLIGYNTGPSVGRVAAFLLKLDSEGQQIWQRSLDQSATGGSDMQYIYAITEHNGGYAAVGSYSDNAQSAGVFKAIDFAGNVVSEKGFLGEERLFDLDYDPSDNTFIVATYTRSLQSTLLKINLSGDVLLRVISPYQNSQQNLIAVAPNPQDGYLLVGTDLNTGRNFSITRLDRSGGVQSSQSFGGSAEELVRSFAIQPNGALVLAGLTQSTDGDLAGRQPTASFPVIWVLSVNISGTTPPVTPPVTPPTGPSGFVLTAPTYDCNTGQLTVNTTGGNGAPIEYRIIGNRDWSASNVFSIPAHQRQGTTFTLDARLVGSNTISIPFTSACGTTPPVTPPVTPPTGTALSFGGSSLICDTGQLTINALGGDGSPIEFKVPGLADWQRSNTFQIPTYQRNGTTFTLYIRQSGREVQITYTPGCAVSRVASSSERGSLLNALVLPNPVVGSELVVEVNGAAGQAVDFALTDVSGRVLANQRAQVATDQYKQTMAVGQLVEGLYLLRVSTPTQSKTLKVMKR